MMMFGGIGDIALQLCALKEYSFKNADRIACVSNTGFVGGDIYVFVVFQDARLPTYRITRSETLLDAFAYTILVEGQDLQRRKVQLQVPGMNGYKHDNDGH